MRRGSAIIVLSKLSKNAVVLADNAHVSDRLKQFADTQGFQFLYFQEKPSQHWYPGAGIGAAFRKSI